MKSQRRHELKENVLAHELARLRDFLNQYGNWITGGIVAVAIVILIAWYFHGRSQRLMVEEQAQFNDALGNPSLEAKDRMDRLEQMANGARDPLIGAESAVRLGDGFADQYLEATVRGAGENAADLRTKAEGFYNLAITKYPKQKEMAARAHFGLASLAESAGELETAKAEYARAEQVAGSNHPVAVEARTAISALGNATQPVRLATTTQAVTRPTVAPAGKGPATATATQR